MQDHIPRPRALGALRRALGRAVYELGSRWQARRGARIVADLGPQRAITATPTVDTRWSTLSGTGRR